MNALLESLVGLRLLDPWLLLLALLIPVALVVRRSCGAPAVRFAPAMLLEGEAAMPSTWRVRLLSLPLVLESVALLLVVVALARPVRRSALPPRQPGIDVFLCLDTSSSMAAKDMDPRRTRLDVAKDAAASFVAGRPHDRIGLIAFARYPDLACPPTLDHAALSASLAAVALVERNGPEDLTGIGHATSRAAQLLRASPAKSRVVVLLTDGEENVATAQTPDEIGPLAAARLCQELGVRVYAIAAGIGVQGPGGEVVPLDTGQVRRLAETTGGRFYEARDAGAMAHVYAEIDALERVELEEPRHAVEERFMPFLAAALGLLLLGVLARSTVLQVLP